MNNNLNIVHIIPHLGGGPGACLTNFLRQSEVIGVTNKVYCLDWFEKLADDMKLYPNLTQGAFWGSCDAISHGISNCDYVLIHYWNHPLLTVFLADYKLPRGKSIFWCHNSGIAEPFIIPRYISDIADKIIFTSESSVQSPNFSRINFHREGITSVVPAVRDLREFINVGACRSMRSSNRNLLYVGSVTKSKMHPDSAFIFSELSLRGCQIKVVGGPDHEKLATEVESFGGKIEIFGQVANVIDFYRDADLFIYPLRNDHYGTTDQVILEALTSGLPVIAFDNPAEAVILSRFAKVKLAKSTVNFVELVLQLVNSPEDLFQLAREAHSTAASLYGSDILIRDLLAILKSVDNSAKKGQYRRMMNVEKSELLALYARASFFDESIFRKILFQPKQGVEHILSAIREGLDYPEQIDKWQSKTRSTPLHYLKYFPESIEMAHLVKQLDNWVG